MKSNDLRNGMAIRYDGKLYVVTNVEHRTPGNLRAFIQVKIKDVHAGKTLERRLSSGEEMEVVDLDRREMEYLFSDGDGATFMDTSSFEQHVITPDTLGDSLQYLAPNTKATILCLDGNPIAIELPASVDLVITETQPGIKGATATNQLKEATCETGLKTRVPPFIEQGERVKIATADGSYLGRVKGE